MNRSELRKQAQRARSGLAHLNDEANRMQNRIDELAAEVERLREALQAICARYCHAYSSLPATQMADEFYAAVSTARNALAQEASK